jgi:TRAP-type C4-dicarboxylate transport system permease small subunit
VRLFLAISVAFPLNTTLPTNSKEPKMQSFINSLPSSAAKIVSVMIDTVALLLSLGAIYAAFGLLMVGDDAAPATVGDVRSIVIGALLIAPASLLFVRLFIRVLREAYLGRR